MIGFLGIAGSGQQEAPRSAIADGDSFCFPLSVCSDQGDLDLFIGLELQEGMGMIDTGAQHAVCGKKQFLKICRRLKTFGLKPRKIPTLALRAIGVGGTTSFESSWELPVGIGGKS